MSNQQSIQTFTGKKLIELQIGRSCTRSTGASLLSIALNFEHMHLLDAQKVVDDLIERGVVIIHNGLIFLR